MKNPIVHMGSLIFPELYEDYIFVLPENIRNLKNPTPEDVRMAMRRDAHLGLIHLLDIKEHHNIDGLFARVPDFGNGGLRWYGVPKTEVVGEGVAA